MTMNELLKCKDATRDADLMDAHLGCCSLLHGPRHCDSHLGPHSVLIIIQNPSILSHLQTGTKEQRTWGPFLPVPEIHEITERHLTFEPQIRRQYKVDILLLKFLCRLSDNFRYRSHHLCTRQKISPDPMQWNIVHGNAFITT